MFRALAIALLAAWLLPGRVAAEDPVTLFAAASLTGVAGELAEAYGATGRPRPRLVFAASSALAKQIERGAPADLFISANPEWMDYLERRGLLEPDSRVDLLANRLVLIAAQDSPIDLEIAPGFALPEALARADSRLVVGDPDHVPAGLYAKAALRSLGVWDRLAPRLAAASDARAALALVERGAAAAGVVYASDALISRRVRRVATFPADSHPPIRYPLATVAGRDRPAVPAFGAFLRSPEAAARFEAWGFTALPADGSAGGSAGG